MLQFSPSAAANKALEEKVQEINGATDKTVSELKERIQSLEKELDNANDLLSSSKLRGQSSCFCLCDAGLNCGRFNTNTWLFFS